MSEWHDLETKGYVVARSFLGPDEVRVLLDDFEKGTPPEKYPFGFKLIGRAALAKAWPKVERALADVRASTSLEVDVLNFLTLSHYINTRGTERTSFLHQDFDLDYKLTRDHKNYLNFWVPLAKPDLERSNLCIIPFDALHARSANAFERLDGSGGHRLTTANGRTSVYGSDGEVLYEAVREPEFVLDFDIEEIAVTPRLAVGDLLLMRGDLLHRTQDSDTPRTAASIRATYSGKTIARERLGPPPPKAASGIHGTLTRCFEALGRSEITIKELTDFADGVR
jgi:hypothetical protein